MKPTKEKILLVEDEQDIRHALQYNLKREGYEVVCASDGKAALALFNKAKPDFVVLDIMLPHVDGLEVLRQIRRENSTPVLILTAKAKEMDRILGLRLGADDYMVKPFSVGELLARIQGILRRASVVSDGAVNGALSIGSMQVDWARYDVTVSGEPAQLTPKEFALLKLLIEAKGKVLSRDHILESVWGHDKQSQLDTRTVDQHIARLRRKLKSERERIMTVATAGYKFLSSPARS
jgi:two-component system alkaline phosphatase synthesis response regulator PhoP